MGLPNAKDLPKSLAASRLRGAAAITQMLDMIGTDGMDDHDMARVFVENELEIRDLVSLALTVLSEPAL